jgi:hypothetical protein
MDKNLKGERLKLVEYLLRKHNSNYYTYLMVHLANYFLLHNNKFIINK